MPSTASVHQQEPDTIRARLRDEETDGVTSDLVLAVSAAHRLGLPGSDQWPTVAAYLLAEGFDGESLGALAALYPHPSGWEVDQLVPGALAIGRGS